MSRYAMTVCGLAWRCSISLSVKNRCSTGAGVQGAAAPRRAKSESESVGGAGLGFFDGDLVAHGFDLRNETGWRAVLLRRLSK